MQLLTELPPARTARPQRQLALQESLSVQSGRMWGPGVFSHLFPLSGQNLLASRARLCVSAASRQHECRSSESMPFASSRQAAKHSTLPLWVTQWCPGPSWNEASWAHEPVSRILHTTAPAVESGNLPSLCQLELATERKDRHCCAQFRVCLKINGE